MPRPSSNATTTSVAAMSADNFSDMTDAPMPPPVTGTPQRESRQRRRRERRNKSASLFASSGTERTSLQHQRFFGSAILEEKEQPSLSTAVGVSPSSASSLPTEDEGSVCSSTFSTMSEESVLRG